MASRLFSSFGEEGEEDWPCPTEEGVTVEVEAIERAESKRAVGGFAGEVGVEVVSAATVEV
jgi:hypothetical protein